MALASVQDRGVRLGRALACPLLPSLQERKAESQIYKPGPGFCTIY
jgi:hypothetical protein